MRYLSRILTLFLCCAPAFSAGAAPVATTSGSNLTSYNPSNAYNNQWATMSNGRYDGNASAKVDFGNCNAVVLRCAQPKCANGGCTDANVAAMIVDGCVKSNDTCSKYGEDLVRYMTGQLVASSVAKVNQQNLAIEQAKAQAEAQAAAAASAAQSEQISQMQNQMYQMQQQMREQQQESARQLEEALASQAAQSQQAIDNMRIAATEAAKQTEAGITSYQQDAINRGIGEEVLARQQMTGQIQTQIEDAETSLTAVKKAMQNAFDYAGCDARGNNCTGPRRIKKWRELATGFLDPYDNTVNKIYDALTDAQMAGVDLSQIYAMLDDTCNTWSQYMCPGAGAGWFVANGYYKKNSNGKEEFISDTPRVCQGESVTVSGQNSYRLGHIDDSDWKQCRPCTWLKALNDGEEIYAGWLEVDSEATDNQRVVACSSSALDKNKLFSRRTALKNSKGMVTIEQLERWLVQVEPSKTTDNIEPQKYCSIENINDQKAVLEASAASKTVPNTSTTKFCVKKPGSQEEDENCPYISPIYAICDTHPYNSGKEPDVLNGNFDSSAQEEMREIIALKITAISQQMYKQYEYLNATLRRLKTQLQKAVLTTSLEAAGAKSETSGYSAISANDRDKAIQLSGAANCSSMGNTDSTLTCISNNANIVISFAKTQKSKACKQLQSTLTSAKDTFMYIRDGNNSISMPSTCDKFANNNVYNASCSGVTADDITTCAYGLIGAVRAANEAREQRRYNNNYRQY